MEQFAKTLNITGDIFRYITEYKTRYKMNNERRKILEKIMKLAEKEAWVSFKNVTKNFFDNYKDPDYKMIFERILQSFPKLECNMSLNFLLQSHLDYFTKVLQN